MDTINALVAEFLDQIQSAIEMRAVALARSAALGIPAGSLASAPAKRGRPRKNAAAPKTSRLARRDSTALAATADKLAAHVASHPGQGIEQIGPTLGLPTKELALPIKKLLAEKRIKREGQRRGTKYFPGPKAGKSSK